MISVLVVDDDRTTRATLEAFLETLGYAAGVAATAKEARELATANAPDIVLLDVRLPDAPGFTLLEALLADDTELGIIMITGRGDVPTALRALQHGALDFLEKPVQLEALQASVARVAELVRLRREVRHSRGPREKPPLGGLSNSLEGLIEVAARSDELPVLIVGASGPGREYLARQIHDHSARAPQPFIEPSASTLERDLFGYERGAFADSPSAKRSLLQLAGGGTVFLSDVGNLSVELQARVLELLERSSYRRRGGTRVLRSNARLIAGSTVPLNALMSTGQFSPELAVRLQVLTLTVPGTAPAPGNPDFSIASAEREAIRKALSHTSGNRLRAAELLGIARSTLLEKLKNPDPN